MSQLSSQETRENLLVGQESKDITLEKSEDTVTPFQQLNVRISDIVKTIPSECFKKNESKAWFFALANVLVVVVGLYGIATLPWYFLPITWIITGTGLAGFFTLGHDCGHYAFSEKRWVNDVVGHLFLLPLLYPFYSWCIEHNSHHTRTNKIGQPGWRQIHEFLQGKTDPNWQPFRIEAYNLMSSMGRLRYRLIRGRFWWTGTILNWWSQIVLDINKLAPKDQNKVRFSRRLVLGFSLVFFPTMIVTVGVWGLIKLWFVPWLIYHFWFSTFTLIHHTSPKTDWKVDGQWNAAEANLCGTVHCDYPWWVEFLSHDINYHIPHHLSTAIPFYNLRKAHQSIRENWGPYVRECKLSWSLINEITTQCHLYDSADEGYISFDKL